MMTMNTAVRQQTAVLGAARSGMGLTTAEGLNMGRQMSDVGVQLAMGMSPFMILIQQGPQVMDIFQQAAIRTGTTVGQVANQMAISWMKALWPLLPIIAAIGLAVGGVAAAFGLAARGINQDAKTVQASLGLTADQMEYLKKKGVETEVTMGDVWNGIGSTIKKVLQESFGDEVKWAQKQWDEFVDGTADVAYKAARHILASYLTGYFGIRDTWKMLPAVIGDVTALTANVVIAGVEQMLNRGREGINRFIIAARGMANVIPGMNLVAGLDTMDAFSLGRVANPNAGAMRQAQGAWMNAARQGPTTADQILTGIGQGAIASRDRRVRAGLEDYKAPNDTADAAERTARGAREAREQLQQIEAIDLQPLRGMFIEIVEPLQLVADEMRLIDGLAQDMAAGLTSAFGKSGAALGDLLTTMSGYQARLADIDLAERKYRLSAMQAERERAHAQVQNYGDMLGAMKGFFEEGSAGYKVLQTAEQAYRVYQFAMMVQEMVLDATTTSSKVANSGVRMASDAAETGVSIGNSLARAGASAIEAVASVFAKIPFPFNIAAAAGLVAVMASFGIKALGGGGGGGNAAGAERDATNSIRSTADMNQARVVGANGTTTIRVVPNDDRFDAYVDTRAQPAAATAYRASVTSSRGIVPADQTRRDRFKLGGKSAYGR